MANISDAFGEITVEKVGAEFIEFLKEVQDENAYYVLAEGVDFDNLSVDSKGDLSFPFGAGGRWAYSSNINGYLQGEWMNDDKQEKAYNKFIKALEDKEGMVTIDYTDSDASMDWMGKGAFEMYVEDGELQCSDNFEEESITLERYAELNGETLYWALEYLKGDEVVEAYDEYVEESKEMGNKPVEPDVWYDDIYEEV
jgi:hypothetical protein